MATNVIKEPLGEVETAADIKADVIVLGGGGCGMAAATAAAEKGAKVVLVEKMGAPGGNSARATGPFAAESPAQRRLSIDAPKDVLFKMTMKNSHWTVNPRIIRAFIDKSGDTIKWIEEKGLLFDNIPPLYSGYTMRTWHCLMSKPAGAEILNVLRKSCENLGVKFLFHCSAKKILTNQAGRVTGIAASLPDKQINILAKTVVIATGGYGGNKELMKKYYPSYSDNMIYYGVPHLKGDGLIMATEIGAATEGLGTIMTHSALYRGSPPINIAAKEPYTVWLNKNGERFADESLAFNSIEAGNAIHRQPDNCVYSLFDDQIKNMMIDEGFIVGGLQKVPGSAGFKPVTLDKDLKSEAAKGGVKIADSWEDIASWMKIAPEILKATVDEYNSFCDKGHDELFAKDRRYLQPLRTPPYYAVMRYQFFLTTVGGIKINHHMEVISENGQPIEGLYAGGDIAGGWSPESYCIECSGTALGFALNSGRICGENAYKYVHGSASKGS